MDAQCERTNKWYARRAEINLKSNTSIYSNLSNKITFKTYYELQESFWVVCAFFFKIFRIILLTTQSAASSIGSVVATVCISVLSLADRPIDRSFGVGPGPASLCPTAPRRRDANDYAHPEEVFGYGYGGDLDCARATQRTRSKEQQTRGRCVPFFVIWGSAFWQRRSRRGVNRTNKVFTKSQKPQTFTTYTKIC